MSAQTDTIDAIEDALDQRFSVSVDTGGTFSDIALLDRTSGQLWTAKTSSTPSDPSKGFIAGIVEALAKADVSSEKVSHVFHGTTVATNAILEAKGARIALLTTKGFRHVTDIGRHDIPRSENLYAYMKPQRPLPASRVFEVQGRLSYSGEELVPLSESDVAAAAEKIRASGATAVAICFLHAYASPVHERKAAAILEKLLPGVAITISSDVLPVLREYERGMTVLLNAYVMPLVSTYVGRLEQRLQESKISSRLLLMKSSGGVAGVDTIRQSPVHTALSGPAAGAVGCSLVGRSAGFPNVIGVDIGGTSADISLISGEQLSIEARGSVGGWPLQVPMVDITTIGAGGGSLAGVTETGRLYVGPQSAGAEPGPVCYGRGGTQPTVTDAHLALGRLPEFLLGGAMRIDRAAARRAIFETIAQPLGMTIEEAAEGILAVADNNMVGAIRVVSVQRGHDPADFALVPFGGAGPLHGVALADLLGIPKVLVPVNPGVLSALGLLATDLKSEFARVSLQLLKDADHAKLQAIVDELSVQAQQWLSTEGIPEAGREIRLWAEVRYRGQGSELRVPFTGTKVTLESLAALEEKFHQQHEHAFTFAQRDTPVELVTLTVEAIGHLPKPSFQNVRGESGTENAIDAAVVGRQSAYFAGTTYDTPIVDRTKLNVGAKVQGPAIVTQLDCTIVVPPAHVAEVDSVGNLIISHSN